MEEYLPMRAITKTVKTMACGSVRLVLEFSPNQAAEALPLFCVPETDVAIVRLTPEAALEAAQNEIIEAEEETPKKKSQGEYGQYARILKTHGFCFNPKVQALLSITGGDDYGKEQATWDSLKEQLGYESMSQVPPEALFAWAEKNGLGHTLPLAYRPE